MLTIVESPLFSRLWPDYWAEAEHDAFVEFIARHPDAGEVVPGSGGCRKVRWSRPGKGKRGGVRVLYTALASNGIVLLLVIHAKSQTENIPAHVLREIAREFNFGSH